ncbi:flagellar motor switch protein FliN/FliY [Hathewaya proteolytica DSM 3090]|uniref:Flagellar motor switch protein FliN/FliY n=1 Tax=Hathewaya proteolytica DSM 3090 TaxID=1121331 RepID=A0A1M6LBY8_9CLOT|nr:flagellar motor switch phosphatase FliY [Hathewaya proteolytica]SHJ68740.1 flagellar motor switch protein FliN/FliY [Hathewaya proteolytica DSM 3090]
MNNGFLSQEEINSLLAGEGNVDVNNETNDQDMEEVLNEIDKDILGELGNISMGSASTTLSTIIGQPVNITTPSVAITTLKKLRGTFDVPNIALDVEYVTGIVGGNVFVMKISDAAVIANLMMGGNGEVDPSIEALSELEVSAVSEAMNQMIGSAATSMATMFGREVNISPPTSIQWNNETDILSKSIGNDEVIVRVAFSMTIGDLVDSTIMQILPIDTAKTIINIMMGNDTEENTQQVDNSTFEAEEATLAPDDSYNYSNSSYVASNIEEKPVERQAVNVKQATFPPLTGGELGDMPHNIDLILDVQLDIAVVLGRTKMNIRDILDLGSGSLIELDKLAEEPVEILVNGKKVAMGEVVVVDENFGVRINSIVSSEDRVRSLGK